MQDNSRDVRFANEPDLRKIGLHPNFWYPLAGFFSDTIFAEDKFVPEAEQRAYDLQGADLNQEVLSFIMDLRHLLIAAGGPAQSGSPPHTRHPHAECRLDP
jgi:hypothetical protein